MAILGSFGLTQAFKMTQGDLLLPELQAHMVDAERYLSEGSWQKALAHTDSILLNTPIRVWFSFDAKSRQNKGYVKNVLKAMSLWQKGMADETLFVIVDSQDEADITINLVEEINKDGHNSGGNISWQRTIEGSEEYGFETKYKADINLAVYGPGHRKLNSAQLVHAATHELGHVLGLQDNATVGNIMGPLDLRRPTKAPTDLEFLALQEARTLANDLRKLAFAVAL